MALTIKVPVSEITGVDFCEKIEDKLFSDKKNAYTVCGIMVDVFGVKPELFENKPFKEWKEDPKYGKTTTMYSKIRNCLTRSVKKGVILTKRQGKKDLYWWNPKVAGGIKSK